jgi:diaminobutyrate-2-oxoglutarate transaminase
MTVGRPIEELHFSDAPNVSSVPGRRSRELIDRQFELESRVVTYPRSLPVAFEEGRGATLRDADGNVYIDFVAGAGVLNVGYSNPYVVEAVREQTGRITHTLDFPSEARVEFLETLSSIAPGDLTGNSRIAFGGPTGTDAIEASIKLARANSDGSSLVAFRGGNHGQTAGALSLSGVNKYKTKGRGPYVPGVEHVPYPYPLQQGVSAEEALERSIRELRELLEDPYSGIPDPIGVWVEAIQGSRGVVVPPREFLPRVRELCDEHHLMLVVDEIQTGMGRTGKWFASEWSETTPDAIAMGKALGGGHSLSGIMFHEKFDTWEPGTHKGTFRGYVPAMVAGTRAIEYIKAHDLLAHGREVGELIRNRLRAAGETSPYVAEIRGEGMLTGIEFHDDEGEPFTEFVSDLQRYCLDHGLVVWVSGRHGCVIRLLPPLVLTHELAERGCDVLCGGIEALTKQYA